MSTRYRVIELLADGHFHSGEWLGRQLGISRAAVWKHVRALSGFGLDVHAVRGQGYRLAVPFQPLSAELICASLDATTLARLDNLEVFREIDSTSDYLRRVTPPGSDVMRACIAEWQSAGRGRRGRPWVSPYGTSLYLSLAVSMPAAGVQSGGLSLVAAIAVLRALQSCGIRGLGLKWPNDIFYQQRKLAGILLDLSGESGGSYQVVMGVGINLTVPDAAARAIDQPWADLSQCGVTVERNHLAGVVVSELVKVIDTFNEKGLDVFKQEWQRFDLIADREVRLHSDSIETISGIARGIDAHGALLIEANGTTRSYHAGEVSVRLNA
ncbi:MAG TPA: bifunctional biotin--[acetyl-CoA-carboxylase] ligase/biotin operon repressor BirA [Gammaproteobacteria bacterium]|nr:bifunctional biotin--[acetyl-CoA-carboxylase] ligase/biotin operon repressor BirA [Gammaproteobacteria bacterium]